ncbi:hypothetical protein S40285_09430 [Stachybotrys chlorohalonatus IBT 40285]|uniref:Uncharacterized protein n=1 Tax=Stachybotrys chlorohalonatus (strain IBT 40285) TaxID=1283841 RepID=A0A084QZ93_STAC4|nr:hypothetical protein S40285_09430 [Stachybotrys chlorohalonata IBT 40285]
MTPATPTKLSHDNFRPEMDPTNRIGTHFEPLDVPNRDLVILPLPSNPFELFQRFLPPQLVQKWVDYTNSLLNQPRDHQGQ